MTCKTINTLSKTTGLQYYRTQEYGDDPRIMKPLKQFHAQKGREEITSSYLGILSCLKKSPYKGWTKVVQSRLLTHPASHIKSP